MKKIIIRKDSDTIYLDEVEKYVPIIDLGFEFYIEESKNDNKNK